MADTTTLQRAELDARRQALKARVSRFRTQLSEDREAVTEEARQLAGSESKLAEHPVALVATSAAVGFAAGVVKRPHIPTPDAGSPVKKVASKGAGAGANLLRVEAGVILKDFVDGLFDHEEGSGEAGPRPGESAAG